MATLTQEWICFILFRFVMPSVFLTATIFRFNLFSLIYGLLMLVNALLTRPTFFSITRGFTGKYLMLVMVLTSITLLMQSIFQIYAAVTMKQQQIQDEQAEQQLVNDVVLDIGNFSSVEDDAGKVSVLRDLMRTGFIDNRTVSDIKSDQNCTLLNSVISQVGLQRIQHSDALNVIRILCPDVAAFLVTLVCLWCCQVWLSKPSVFRPCYARAVDEQICKCANIISLYMGNTTLVALIATAGILRPSLINLVYFLVFILSMTMWSLVVNTNSQLIWFQRIRYFTASYVALHLLLIYLRQFPLVNNMWRTCIVEGSLLDRLLGVVRFTLITNGCSEPQFVEVRTNLPPLCYIHVVVLIILYFVIASEIRRWRLKMKFFTIRSVVNVNSIHQKILLKSGDAEEYVAGNDGMLRSVSRTSNHGSIGSVGFDTVSPFPNVDPNRNHTIGSLSSFYAVKEYALKQSYIGTLIVMMVWSITYHSWLTFVLLLSACIIWIVPMKRALCLKFSPIILFYAIGLLMLQYIYGLDLTNEELPDALKNGFELRDIGLMKYTNPAGPLAIKLMFTCAFWLTLRHSQERKFGLQQQDNDFNMDTFGLNKRIEHLAHSHSRESDTIRNIGFWIWHTMCKYWIFACAGLFLFISLQEAVVFRLIYMSMFLYFVITFQVSYKFWRMSIQVFWWVVILYSMGVLTCIYTFQFKGFPDHWKYITGMSDQMLLNLGLKTIDTTELFIDLLTPTSFLIVVSIQLHYFQKDFLKMSDLNRFKSMGVVEQPERMDTTESSAFTNRRGKKDKFLVLCTYLWNKFYTFLHSTSAVLWRFVEVHIFKVTASTIFICCVAEVSALNTLLILVVVILLPFPRLHSAMLILEMILSSAILLFKMIYQMDIIVDDLMSSNCSPIGHLSNETVLLPPFNQTLNNTDFIGIHKVKNMAKYLMIYVLMILVLSLESIVRYHQIQHYRHPKHERPMDRIVFMNIKRIHADQGLTQCFKFFVNYSFYKFGKELCFIMTMTTMVVRLDMYSVVYGLFLGILLLLNRRQCGFVWPFYVIILVILLIAQYLSCVGAPPALCWIYPWSNNEYMHRNLQIFLYLPDYDNPPCPQKLICDFFQLMFVCLQWNVFYIETNKLDEYGGGDNRSIYLRLTNKVKNPQSDFLSYKDSYLDYIKMVVFFHSFWVTLMVVFISGMSRISLFCMGYLIGCFVFLWFGEGMLLKPLKKLTAMWMGLLMYCYLVLVAKCILQLIGCVYLTNLISKHCWVIQLFNMVCLRSTNYISDDVGVESVCKNSPGEAGLSLDAFCFVFLLFMLRIFKTWYFQHVVNELRINSKLAARGAELINNKLIDDINMVKANEERVLQNIKLKMDRIRTKHAACMQERLLSKEQFADHYTVIRSGDYYMFKDVEEDDVELAEGDTISEEEESNNKENDDWRRKRTTVAPTTLLATAFFGGGPKEALSLIEKTSNFSRSMSMSSAREFTTPEDEAQSPSSILDGTTSTVLGSELDDARTTVAEKCSSPGSTFSPSTHTSLSVFPPPAPIPEGLSANQLVPCSVIYQKVMKYSDIMPSLPEVTLEMENETSPMTSKTDAPTQDIQVEQKEDTEEDDVDETTKKVETGLKMLKVVLIGFIDTLIIRINNSTRHYRSVSLKLHEEKEREKILLRDSVRIEYKEEFGENEEDLRDGYPNQKEDEINNLKRKENEFHNTMPRLIVLVIAVSEALVARTDLLCYFAMVFNTIMSGSILSMVYPLSVFFWAMLSVPRTTKFYWVAAITYTEFIIVMKYLFQFNFFPWNTSPSTKGPPSKFTWPQIIGIEKKELYAALDFFVLFCLFIHRTMLKKRGLWTQGQKDESKDETKSSTFEECVNLNPLIADSDAVSLAAGDCGSKNTDDDKNQTPCQRLLNPVKFFYINITNPKYSAVNDVFAYMFACDLFTFLIVVFGYNRFGPSEQLEDSDVATVIQQSRVPVPFLAMLLVQFILIIIDRALYLRKLIFGKFIFHIVLVIIVHIWMFFLLPMIITDIPFVQNRAAQLWYFTKCIYFSFSCYQVRSGYPIRILGNFLTKKFGYFNLFCFKGFLAIPFLLELRALTDWMWTDTTLALTSWLQMEDIYANVFVLKCWRKIEHDSPTPRAVPRHPVVKYGLGGLVLFLLIFIIWLPLLLFSMSNSIYEANPPTSVNFKLSIGGYNTSAQPIFSVISQRNQLHPLEPKEYQDLKKTYLEKPKAMAFLNAHREEDVYRIMIGGTSTSTWEISYPTEQRLINELKEMHNMSFTVEISITREPTNGVTISMVSVYFVRHLNSSDEIDKNVSLSMARMINGSYNVPVIIPRMFPRYLTVPSRKNANETGALDYGWRSVVLSLHQKKDDRSRWWEMKEKCPNVSERGPLDNLVCETAPGSMIIAFSERIPTGVFTLVNNYGVIGLYVSVILVIGRFVRMQSVGNIQTIMFTNLPYVDRLYGLCMDIYLVRQAREFAFEELLFAKLNFLYRSTETMIAWTRHPKPKSE